MPSLVILYYIASSYSYFLLNSHAEYRLDHILTLATQNCLPGPPILVMALDGFSALQFVPSAPEVFAEIKTTIFHKAFCPIMKKVLWKKILLLK